MDDLALSIGRQGSGNHNSCVIDVVVLWKVPNTVADSMEEASALSNKVAIVATRMLAVGTTSDLAARYANYEVHFSARTREESLRAREVMARVPDAQAVDDVATRFEVSIQDRTSSKGISLASLFAVSTLR